MSSKKKESESGILGQFVFAPQRRKENIPPEQNTADEQNLLVGLSSFLVSNNPSSLTPLTGTMLKALSQAFEHHDYQQIVEPGHVTVYRGISVPIKTILAMTKDANKSVLAKHVSRWHSKDEIVDPAEDFVTYTTVRVKGQLTPQVLSYVKAQSPIQSWTTDPDKAVEFAMRAVGFKSVPAVFVAHTESDGNIFFGKPGKLAKIIYPEFEGEKETLSIGPVTYSKVVFARALATPTPGKPRVPDEEAEEPDTGDLHTIDPALFTSLVRDAS